MIELFIDEQPVDLDAGCSVKLSLSLQEITAPETATETVFPLTLPLSARNRTALGFPEQGHSTKRFNREKHSGKITCRGAVLLNAPLELTGCEVHADGSGCYKLLLRVPPPAWIGQAALKKLSEIPIAYDNVLNEQTIRESWTDRSPVKFLPVKWDAEPEYGQSYAVLDKLSYENYYPFVQVKALLDAIAGAAGYRIESQFLNEPFFQSLYMSGRYGGTSVTENVSRMDFSARRNAADKSTTANSQGKIFTSAVPATNSVAPAVDAANPEAAGDNPFFGQSLRTIDGRLAFVPEADVIAGFEWRLNVKFTPKLYSPTQLLGISRIGWGDEILCEPFLPNPLVDRKNIGGNSEQLRVVCFDNQVRNRKITIYYTHGSSLTFSLSNPITSVNAAHAYSRAVCEELLNGQYVPVDNWALYVGAEYNAFVDNLQTKELSLTLNSIPRLRARNEPVFFDTLWFETAPGNTVTLCRGATVRPLFFSMPQAGEPVTFASLFAHEKKQRELVGAVAHLFGLHFYTDDAEKTIRIEPRFTFLDNTHPVDWTQKIDPEKPVVWEDTGSDRYQIETLGYRSGDAPTERADVGSGTTFGEWSVRSGNRFARRGEKRIKNPLFTATRDERNSLRSAPDASLIVVGDRSEKQKTPGFPEKIIRYLGMMPLPAGQQWGWPAPAQEYPAAGFSPAMDWFTLCFDDENGQLGLRHYHQPLYELAEKGKKLTLYLHLSPSDIEAVRYPNSTCRDFRGNFIFRIRGEKFQARLVEISGYDPAGGGSTRCSFTVES